MLVLAEKNTAPLSKLETFCVKELDLRRAKGLNFFGFLSYISALYRPW